MGAVEAILHLKQDLLQSWVVLFNLLFILAQTGATTLSRCLPVLLGIGIVASLLRTAYSLDRNNRLTPHTLADDSHPH